jgi:hypothetical protein
MLRTFSSADMRRLSFAVYAIGPAAQTAIRLLQLYETESAQADYDQAPLSLLTHLIYDSFFGSLSVSVYRFIPDLQASASLGKNSNG